MVRFQAPDAGRPETVTCRSGNAMIGTTQEVIDDARRCQDISIQQLTYDFRADEVEAQMAMMERLAERVAPAVAA
jgi:hypothetical protein